MRSPIEFRAGPVRLRLVDLDPGARLEAWDHWLGRWTIVPDSGSPAASALALELRRLSEEVDELRSLARQVTGSPTRECEELGGRIVPCTVVHVVGDLWDRLLTAAGRK